MRSIVLFSGGIDSSTLALKLQREGHDVHCLTFDLGAGRNEEVRRAEEIAKLFGLQHTIIPISTIAKLLSPNFDMMVGGSYNDGCKSGSDQPNSMSIQTMHTLAAYYAAGHNISQLGWAVHMDDQEARELAVVKEKIRHFEASCRLHGLPMTMLTPFLGMRKTEVVSLGQSLGLNINLTYSCSAGKPVPCGLCRQCRVRDAALLTVAV